MGSAVSADAFGLVVANLFSARYSSQLARHLRLAVVGNDDFDVGADRFPRGIPEQLLGSRIPGGNRAIEAYGHDGVVSRLQRGKRDLFTFRQLANWPKAHQPRLSLMTMRTRSATFFAPSFPMMCAR